MNSVPNATNVMRKAIMNLCGVRVNRIQELWLTRQQFGDGREAFAVVDAGAKFSKAAWWKAVP